MTKIQHSLKLEELKMMILSVQFMLKGCPNVATR